MAGLLGAQDIARRMAAAAVGDRLGEIGAAVPLRIPRRIRLIRTRREIDCLPCRLQGADIERERHAIGWRLRFHGRQVHQVRVERADVLVGELGEVVDGEGGGEEMLAVARDAVTQRPGECVERPVADAGFRIRRDVARIDGAEQARKRPAAGTRLSILRRMAIHATRGTGQHLALVDQRGGKGSRSRRIDRRDRRLPGSRHVGQHRNAAHADETQGPPDRQQSLPLSLRPP
jgi:hypothetical protein